MDFHRLPRYAAPYYEQKNMMHNLMHIQQMVESALHLLALEHHPVILSIGICCLSQPTCTDALIRMKRLRVPGFPRKVTTKCN